MRRLSLFPVLLGLVVLGAFAALAGCGRQSPTSAVGTGTVRVQLTDDPASYDAVNLQVVEVAVHRAVDDSEAAGEGSDSNGWEVLSDQAATYDLLTLRNGVFTTMAIGQVPAGHYTQVRLRLGSGSNVVADGVSHDLKVPSGIQSGYKLIGGFDVPAGGSVDIAIDFDASRSIVHTGAGTYILKPTARVVVAPAATTGSIHGVVDPTDVAVAAFAISGPDTVGASATVPGDGSFVLPMLAPGSYDVALHPSAIYADTTIAGVNVTAGGTTDLGTITLTPQ
jgi:Domain of unknown function (DUF4382)